MFRLGLVVCLLAAAGEARAQGRVRSRPATVTVVDPGAKIDDVIRQMRRPETTPAPDRIDPPAPLPTEDKVRPKAGDRREKIRDRLEKRREGARERPPVDKRERRQRLRDKLKRQTR